MCIQRCLGNIGAFSALLLENQVMAFRLEIIFQKNSGKKWAKCENSSEIYAIGPLLVSEIPWSEH